MLQKISSVFVVYRRKTLTGSPDPTHANGTDKPCTEMGGVPTYYLGKVYENEENWTGVIQNFTIYVRH